jgi:predicted RNA-binding Zn-ribbon protein involved in translation (DUF1610 family)
MFPTPNYIWECKACGKKLTAFYDEERPQLETVPPKCPKCGEEMVGNPAVRRGPFPENPFKKY